MGGQHGGVTAPPPSALLFDVFGTLVDWRGSLLDTAAEVAGATGVDADWEVVVDDWRRAYQPALDAVRAAPGWRDLDAVHRDTLSQVCRGHGLALPESARETLVQAWHRLRPWPDVPDGLARLRRVARTATLSNGHVGLLVDLLRAADLRVDAPLSAQLVGSYKPDPATYRRAVELLGCEPGRTAMVAAHAGDLVAAAAVGLRPVFVRRPLEWGPAGGEDPPRGLAGLLVADDLGHLATLLGA